MIIFQQLMYFKCDLHKSLLIKDLQKLSEVLLEKTRISVPKRAYGVVRTVDEIPLTSG